MKKSIAVLGMGRFGQFLTDALCKKGADVLIVDEDEETIRRFSGVVSCAIKADLCDPEAIRAVGLADVDIAVVSMGSSLESSFMCVMVAKELGVPYLIAKAASLRMGKGEYDLSEMYVVEKTYNDRAYAAVRTHGDVSFSYFIYFFII